MAFTDRLANRGSISTASYEIENSVLLNGRYSDGSITQTGGDRKTHTISFWHKRAPWGWGTGSGEMEATTNDMWGTPSEGDTLRFNGSQLGFFQEGGSGGQIYTDAMFRDCSAWYHFVIAVDTTQGTAANRLKMYVNGVQQTEFGTEDYPDQNAEFKLMQSGQVFNIGKGHSPEYNAQGYFAEFIIVDGAAKTASDFGEFDSASGIWKPKEYTGDFNTGSGTNGAHYKFEGTAEGTGGSATGIDSSGNSNTINFRNQVGGLTDTPTNNFCTMILPQRPAVGTAPDVTNGGLTISGGGSGTQNAHGSFGVRNGKWYYESTMSVLLNDSGGENHGFGWLGVDGFTQLSATAGDDIGKFANGWAMSGNGNPRNNNSHSGDGYSGTAQENVVLGCALDMDNGKIWWSIGGTWITQNSGTGNPATGAYPSFTNLLSVDDQPRMPATGRYIQTGVTREVNFGNPASTIFTGVGTNADENGYGSFAYTPPSGFYALCSKNLAEFDGTDIDDPSAHFQVAKWTGNSQGDSVASRTITNDGNSSLQPDMLWTIPTDIDSYNWIYDSTRGFAGHKALTPAYDWAQSSAPNTGGYPSAVTSDGFTVVKGSSGTVATEYVNQAAHQNGTTSGHATSYVAYQWKANGGTTTSFSAESAASGSLLAGSYQANTTSGFSIVTYTGDGGTPRTALHGLGVAPEVIITKRIPSSGDWMVLGDHMYHTNPWDSNAMELNNTDNSGGSKNTVGGNYAPTTTRYYIGDHADVNASSSTYISYCFTPKQGFSKFGIYEGLANANGPFIYTGFKPAWVLVKNLDNDGWNWALIDHKRTPFNGEGVAKFFWPDLAQKEFTDADSGIDMDMDLLSNGFKITTARSELNLASTFFYMAFAESPFITSDGVPVTGR